MINQIKTLTKFELINLFQLNVYRHTKDAREKKRQTVLAVVLLFVALSGVYYVGGQTYALIKMGAADFIGIYLVMLASILILLFDFFKAAGTIFRKNGYDMLAAFPVSQTAIVVSRFAKMYVENLLLTALSMLPGILVYIVMQKPSACFLLFGITGILFVPLIPMSAAVLIGTLIVGISSRMKHKSIVEALLSVALVVAVLAVTSGGAKIAAPLDEEQLQAVIQNVFSGIGHYYPTAFWLQTAMHDADGCAFLLFAGLSVAAAVVVVAVAALGFRTILRNLFGTTAKHNYQMQTQEQDTLLLALTKRELRRYFASGIYVTNTIIGPVMSVVASIALFVLGTSALTEQFPIAIDVNRVAPFVIALLFSVMNSCCVSISMEGKHWWILKTLPLDMKMVLQAKLLCGLAIVLPFYAVAEIFFLLALKPGLVDAVLLLAVPLVYILFNHILSLRVNLLFPMLKWEDEVSVVKQSTSALLGGLGGMLIPLVSLVLIAVAPEQYARLAAVGLCFLLLAATGLLYSRNNRTNLMELE